jgi:hypothetical protein
LFRSHALFTLHITLYTLVEVGEEEGKGEGAAKLKNKQAGDMTETTSKVVWSSVEEEQCRRGAV